MPRTVDAVVVRDGAMLFIRRGRGPFTGYLALPGGKIDAGETPAMTVVRELREETGLEALSITEIGVFDAPGRDPRGDDFVSTAFVVDVDPASTPKAGDDAKEAVWLPLSELATTQLAFDHNEIVAQALKLIQNQ